MGAACTAMQKRKGFSTSRIKRALANGAVDPTVRPKIIRPISCELYHFFRFFRTLFKYFFSRDSFLYYLVIFLSNLKKIYPTLPIVDTKDLSLGGITTGKGVRELP